MKVIEQKVKHCSCCGKKTKHQRNSSRIGFVGILINLALIVITAGFWLIPLILWALLSARFGGWSCEECGK